MKINNIEPRKCPICGGDPQIILFKLDSDTGDYHETYKRIECKDCRSTTSIISSNTEKLINEWNRNVLQYYGEVEIGV